MRGGGGHTVSRVRRRASRRSSMTCRCNASLNPLAAMAFTYAGSIWCEAGKRLLRWASMAKNDGPYSTRLRVTRLRVGFKGFYSASVRRPPRSCAQQNLRPVACGCCRTCLGRRLSIRRRHDVVVPRSWCARRTRRASPGGAARLYAACSARYTLLPAAALVDSCESARAEAL